MKKSKFSIAHKDEELVSLVNSSNKKTLAVWAIDCAEHVMPYFEKKYPKDARPRQALKTLKAWLDAGAGTFKMAVIRKASLDSHAAARDVGEDSPARSAARAAGQAVATVHVPRHAYGSAIYAQQAIHRDSSPSNADIAVIKERDWQYRRLLKLKRDLNKE